MVAMWHFQDLSTLGILVTDIAGQIIVYLGYLKKSTAENSSGGIVYETTMAQLNNEYNIGSGMEDADGNHSEE